MASPTPENELIALIFSSTPQDASSWQNIFTSLTSQLSTHFHTPLPVPRSRFLDISPSEEEIPSRVAELTISLPHPITLPTCTTLTNTTLHSLQTSLQIELLLQPHSLYTSHRHPGLAVFDMDSTLIQQEVIDELARAVGLYQECAAITAQAMRGEPPYVDFEASLRARVRLLEGVPVSVWEGLKRDVIHFTPGARELIRGLGMAGWRTAVLSGGFMELAEWVKGELGLDFALANFLEVDEGRGCLTGRLVEGREIVDGVVKRRVLLDLAAEYGVPIERVIAVGDGANDLKMMEVAGLGVAFHAKPKVQLAAPSRLNTESLMDVLYVLGYTKGEVDALLRGD